MNKQKKTFLGKKFQSLKQKSLPRSSVLDSGSSQERRVVTQKSTLTK